MKPRVLSALFSLAVAAQTPTAFAEADATSRALAVQQFDEAEALFAKGATAEACPKYAESYRQDPQLGVLIYLAECYEKNGQLASAWGSFREAQEVAQKRGDPRASSAATRAQALEPRLSYLVVQVPTEARLPGLTLLRDGAAVAEVMWGSRAAIDSGKHHIEARAPGYKPWQSDFAVPAEGGATNVAVPQLEKDLEAGQDAGATSTQPSGDASPGTTQRMAAIAVGGLGILALGAGGFFGLSAQSSNSDSKALCSEKNFCTPKGDELRSGAQSKALVATIATGVGVAGLATAAVLWFTAASKDLPPDSQAGRPAKRARRAWAVAPASSSWGLEVTGAF